MDKFKIGDRALFTCRATIGGIEEKYQDTGTIVSKRTVGTYAIRLDHAHPSAHTCDHMTEEQHGYYCNEEDLRIIPQKRRYKKTIRTLRSFLLPHADTKGEVIHNDDRSNEAKH